MECDKCPSEAVMHAAYSGLHMCEEHFCASVEKRVRRRVREDNLLPDDASIDDPETWVIGLSGGKDSVVLTEILADTFAEDPRIELIALSIHEGIDGYRDESLDASKELTEKLEIQHEIVTYEDEFDVRMDDVVEEDPEGIPHPDIVVDGLLGTGFSGELRKDYTACIRWINRLGQRAFVLALDVPSGMSGETGSIDSDAVRADCTVTFQACKSGLFGTEGMKHTGSLHVAPIGIPAWIGENNPPSLFALDEEVFRHLPRPEPAMHKGNAGHVLIIGGSAGMTGAPALAGLGALHAGAGLVTVASPADICGQVKQGWPELMSIPLQPAESWSEESFSGLKKELTRFDAVVLGPGLGRDKGAIDFVRTYLRQTCLPTIFDADALFALSQDRSLMTNLSRDDVLTPHPGEMARLRQTTTEEVQLDRIGAARAAATETGCSVVLKGAGSVVSHPEAPDRLSPFASSNLAVGGSGDVLAGIIGSLIARRVPSLEAACLGVYWHGRTGVSLSSDFPLRGNLARDIAYELPRSINL